MTIPAEQIGSIPRPSRLAEVFAKIRARVRGIALAAEEPGA